MLYILSQFNVYEFRHAWKQAAVEQGLRYPLKHNPNLPDIDVLFACLMGA